MAKPAPGTPLVSGHPLTAKCVAYWPLSEGSGTTAYDAKGGRTATFGTGFSWGTEGGLPCGVFAGAATQMFSGTGLNLSGSAWTVIVRYRIAADTNPNYFWQHGSSAGTRQLVHLGDVYSQSSDFRLYGDDWSPDWHGKALDQIHEVAFVMDAAGAASLYVDRGLRGTYAFGGPIAPNTDFFLGGAPGPGSYFNGKLLHFAVFNQALTAAEVSDFYVNPYAVFGESAPQSYTAEVLADAPAGYWRLEEASGGTVTDASGNGLTGTYAGLAGGHAYAQPAGITDSVAHGLTNSAFNTTGPYIDLGFPAAFNSPAAFTLEAWVWADNPVNQNEGGQIIGCHNNGNQGYGLLMNANAGSDQSYRLHLRLQDGVQLFDSLGRFALSAWNHVVATYDGTTYRLYGNGVLDREVTATTGAGFCTSSNRFGIAHCAVGWGGPAGFRGLVDEAAFYTTALSPARIAAHFAASRFAYTGQTAAPVAPETPGTWTTNTGATTGLYAAIDEATADDADYIRSVAGPSNTVYETAFGALVDPLSSVGHSVAVRAHLDSAGPAATLTTEVRQGASALSTPASWTDALTTTAQTFAHTLSAAQADAITDYADVRLRVTADQALSVPNAPTFWTAGAGVGATTAALTVPYPASFAVDDIALLFVERAGGSATPTLTTPAGFVQIPSALQSTGATTAGTKMTVFWRRVATGTVDPVVAASADHQYAAILTFRGCVTTGDPWDVVGGGVKATASATFAATGVTTTVANTLVLYAIARDNDANNGIFSAQTNASLTGVAENFDNGTNQGLGGGFMVASGAKAVAGASGTMTGNVTSGINAWVTLALKPPGSSPATSRVRVTWATLLAPAATGPAPLVVSPAPVSAGTALVAPSISIIDGPITPAPVTAASAVVAPAVVQPSLTLAPAPASAAADRVNPTALIAAAPYYVQAVLQDGPIGYWRFGEGGGTRGYDTTGHGYDCTFPSGGAAPVFGAAGAIPGDTALGFTGNQYAALSSGYTAFDLAADLSLEVWVYPTSRAATYEVIAKCMEPASFSTNYQLRLATTTGLPEFLQVNGSGYMSVAAAAAPALNAWSHLVVTKSGSTVTHYLNGVANGTGTISNVGLLNYGSVRFAVKEGFTGYYVGRLDEVAIYGTALSPQRVLAHYQSQSGTTLFVSPGAVSARAALIAPSVVTGGLPTAALTDDFDDNSVDTSKWGAFADAGVVVREASSRFEIDLNDGGTGYGALTSTASYDLTGSFVVVECLSPGTGGVGRTCALEAELNASNVLKFVCNGPTLAPEYVIAGTPTYPAGVTFGAATRWWRLREAAGTLYWEHSTTGTAGDWTVLHTLAVPFGVTALTLKLSAGTYVNVGAAGVVAFDNFNLPAVPAPLVVSPTPVGAASSLVAPTVRQASLALTPAPAAAPAAVVVPTVVRGSVVAVPTSSTSAAALVAPTVRYGSVTTAPTPASSATAVVAPAVRHGSITALPAPATARTALVAPSVSIVDPPTYVGAVLTDNPIAYWRLGEAAGTIAEDRTGHGVAGTYVNSPTLGAPGSMTGDTSTTFNGTNQYVTIAANPLLAVAGAFTIEAWIKTTKSDQAIYDSLDLNGTGVGGFLLETYSGRFYATVGKPTYFSTSIIGEATEQGGIAVSDGQWHHVAARYDGVDNFTLFIDGAEDWPGGNSIGVYNPTAWSGPRYIGRNRENYGYFLGSIDEVAVYGTALSNQRIADHYAASGGPVVVTPYAVSARTARVNPAVTIQTPPIVPAPATSPAAVVAPVVVHGSIVSAPTAAGARADQVAPTVVRSSLVLTPVPSAAATTVVVPTVVRGSIVVPNPVDGSATATVAPTVIRGSLTLTALPSSAATTVVAPTLVAGAILYTPVPAAARALVVDPIIAAAGALVVQPVSAATALVAPTVVRTSVVAAPGLVATRTATVAPTLLVSTNPIVPAPAAAATALVAPAVRYGSVAALPLPVTSAASLIAPTVVRGSIVLPNTIVSGAASRAGPTVVANALVLPVPVAAAAAAPPPTVVRASIVSIPTPATSATTVVAPVIIQGSVAAVPLPVTAATALGIGVIDVGTLFVFNPQVLARAQIVAPVFVRGSVVYVPASATTRAETLNASVRYGSITFSVAPVLARSSVLLAQVVYGSIAILPVARTAGSAVVAPTVRYGSVVWAPTPAAAKPHALNAVARLGSITVVPQPAVLGTSLGFVVIYSFLTGYMVTEETGPFLAVMQTSHLMAVVETGPSLRVVETGPEMGVEETAPDLVAVETHT